ncbi:Mechanosensitive ion channel MscS [Corchorus olitorius]|uniref:Mechanosensitive ion channel MscS n=1 Tax=Corchorus olitorius TaxID=93759 RepID=A0A1R3JZU8_9ROSI|nr:Mechanosensitive ion channel MscS [Corchorus olitorius]
MSFSSKADKSVEPIVSASASSGGEIAGSDSSVVGSEWVDKVKEAWHSVVDGIRYTGNKAKEASNELQPHVEQLLDSHPYLKDVIVPVGLTLTGTVLAWVVMPRILRRFHNYAMQRSVLSSGSLLGDQVPYEKSFWGALEDPVRYLITFMAISQIGMMVAPSTIASQYVAQAWRGGAILSLVWFLHRWKTNVLDRMLAAQNLAVADREKLLTVDKVSSVGLFGVGLMALAEACGVAVQSILTVGGIGGVATAFAARDILGNVLSGLSMQFSKPFSLGDTIKAGSIEGQVVDMGLTSTTLLNSEKFPVLVPNSLFSSQVIINKSRAQWRGMMTKIPFNVEDVDKIPQISTDIKSMLRSNPKVFLGKEAPYCFLSHIESSSAELTIGCNLRHMSKEELYSAQEDILLQSVQIIKKHGAALGNTYQGTTRKEAILFASFANGTAKCLQCVPFNQTLKFAMDSELTKCDYVYSSTESEMSKEKPPLIDH